MILDVACACMLAVLGANVLRRLARGLGATAIAPAPHAPADASISVIVPVLDESARIAACLRGLIANGPEVGEILVVDGGSRDDTAAVVRAFAAMDARVRAIGAAPVPAGWNGKAWGLDVGLRNANPAATWIATVDADVIAGRGLFAAMAAHANARNVDALSVATRQIVADAPSAVLHASMLATLVYRFGIPGREARRVADVQANGQCFLARRALLLAHGAFGNVRTSRCEDVTLARALVAAGVPVGFYEAPAGLATVQMYANARELWCNWPRSLTLRDRYARFGGWAGLLEVALVQALPLPLLVALGALGAGAAWTFRVAAVLTAMRVCVMCGTARAYVRVFRSYPLSLLADVPVVCALGASLVRRTHVWRGRELVR